MTNLIFFNLHMAALTDGYIFFLHIVNTFRVAHLHALLIKIFLTISVKVILNIAPSLVRPIPLKPGTRVF